MNDWCKPSHHRQASNRATLQTQQIPPMYPTSLWNHPPRSSGQPSPASDQTSLTNPQQPRRHSDTQSKFGRRGPPRICPKRSHLNYGTSTVRKSIISPSPHQSLSAISSRIFSRHNSCPAPRVTLSAPLVHSHANTPPFCADTAPSTSHHFKLDSHRQRGTRRQHL